MGARGRVSGRIWVGALALAGAAAAWALTAGPLQGAPQGSEGPGSDAYGSELWRYETGTGQRFVALPGGEAAMAYGSPDRHRLVVQFRAPDGGGWTAPETIYRDDRLEALDEVLRYGGGTVAIAQEFVPPDAGDDDSGVDSVVLACRGTTCAEPVHLDGYVDEPQVADDGLTALFDLREGEVVRWTPERGVHQEAVAGVPRAAAAGGAVASEPLLSPDGGLRIVSGTAAGGRCELRLLAGPRDDAELAEVARTRVPGRGGRSCEATLDTFSSDWVQVDPEARPAETFWWVREGGAWARTSDDPSGLVTLDGRSYDGRACCQLVVYGALLGWDQLALGSPDGRTFSLQAHVLGEESWRPRQLVEGAPAGVRCTSLGNPSDDGDRVVALLTCHTGRIGDPYRGDAVAVVGSEDLRDWDSFFVRGLDTEPTVTEEAVVVSGDRLVVWESGSDPREIDLPVPDGSATTRSPGGDLVQARSRREGRGCALDVVTAAPDATAWSDPVPSGVGVLDAMPDCRIDGAYPGEGSGARFLLEDGERGTVVGVRRSEDGWIAERSRGR